jgi:hypothetical protein
MILRALVVAGLALAAPLEALATPITFTFTGTVASVAPALAGTFNTTQTLSGSYTFESSSPDLDPADPTRGVYQSPLVPNALSFTIGSYAGGRTGPAMLGDQIRVFDNVSSQADVYNPAWRPALSGPNVGGLSPDTFVLQLPDLSQTAFSSDALPLTPPNLAAFGNGAFWGLFFQNQDGTQFGLVEGRLTSLELAPVPEPATVLLLGSSFAGVGLVRWRQRRGKLS